jgi:hypothetical protein
MGYIKKTDEILTAKVIDSLENQNITQQVRQIKEGISFEDRNISYYISENCSVEAITRLFDAMKTLSYNTPVKFYNFKEDSELKIECLNSSSKPTDDLTKISEGGPTLMYNDTIIESKIVLYNGEEFECDFPVPEIHELLHALGFDHTTNQESIMYPLASCKQRVDKEIVLLLNKIYTTKP